MIQLRFTQLRVPLKMTFRHASAARTHGDSVWVEASRDGVIGYGEGCPRPYVTGETKESCMEWIGRFSAAISAECDSLEATRAWVSAHENDIDKSPSVWCAIELALLDLFARESGQSVENTLGLPGPGGPHVYSAVLGIDEDWKTQFLIDQYLILGLTDFKVKLCGDLAADQSKLKAIEDLTRWHNVTNYRVRLDANNLWADAPSSAAGYLNKLGGNWIAIEEPVNPRDVQQHSEISRSLGKPIILDESLCTMADLHRYDGADGAFIANLKVSRVGGVLRGLKMIGEIRRRNWPVIIGAHVGETSVLTRAAMLVASAAGDALLAQEGGFGSRLVEREPARPSLRWGRAGTLDLRRMYAEVTTEGLQITPVEAWQSGWGVKCRPSGAPWKKTESESIQTMSDGYGINCRWWGPQEGEEVFVILHGGMSHSLWQRPLAEAIRARSTATVFAPDRRGCGKNELRGDLGSAIRTIDDVLEHLEMLGKRFQRVHLAGWCQGAQYAAVAAERLQHQPWLKNLLLITPGLFWNARFRSVIDMTERVVQSLLTHFDLAPTREEAFVPIPLQAVDFTQSPRGLDFIDADSLKTTEVTLKSVIIMDEVQERSWESILKIQLPVFALTATQDRIVDNNKVRQYLAALFNRAGNRIVELDAGHAVQLEQADRLAEELINFAGRAAFAHQA